MVKVSLAGVNTGFENPAPGTYEVVATKYTENETDPEKPKYRLQMTIASPESAAGKMLFDNGSLQAHVLFGFKRMIAAFDPKHPALESSKQFDTTQVAKDIIGKRGTVVVTNGEVVDGRQRINTNYVLASEKVGAGWAG